MPPKWALGYHQCRWSYASDERVLEVHPFNLFHFMIYSLLFLLYCHPPTARVCMLIFYASSSNSMNSYLLNLLMQGPYNFAGCKDIQRKGYTL